MRILLDTCAIIWAASQPERLSLPARKALTQTNTLACVSPIACAELACLQERGRIEIEGHWKPWFNQCVRVNGWRVLDITVPVIQEAYSLPELFHRDPADRILVGTARVHDLSVLTADERILSYPHVKTLW